MNNEQNVNSEPQALDIDDAADAILGRWDDGETLSEVEVEDATSEDLAETEVDEDEIDDEEDDQDELELEDPDEDDTVDEDEEQDVEDDDDEDITSKASIVLLRRERRPSGGDGTYLTLL